MKILILAFIMMTFSITNAYSGACLNCDDPKCATAISCDNLNGKPCNQVGKEGACIAGNYSNDYWFCECMKATQMKLICTDYGPNGFAWRMEPGGFTCGTNN